MEYSEVDIKLNQIDPFAEILIAKLDEIQFESYLENENGLKAYVPTHLLNENAIITPEWLFNPSSLIRFK